MNRDFISIKVDREERPDIDAVYMKAVQIMTGQGGWPMNVICLPDGRPVWGGTYFPKREWIASLSQLAEMYRSEPQKVTDYAEKLHQGIVAISLVPDKSNDGEVSQNLVRPLVEKWKKSFDTEFGGYGRAPKFMMPDNLRFLLRYGFRNNDKTMLDHVNLTLTKMAYGGLFDTIGGGFSRYSVDMKWHVPHFEKMLYDNGQLISLYADAFKLTKDPLYRETVEKTLEFISRELTNPEGGFYSALDADSLNTEGHLEEGAFYVWTKPELEKLLGDDFSLFSDIYNINDFGHWEHGNYVLIRNQSDEQIAAKNGITTDDLKNKKRSWEQTLFAEREKRQRPRLDDKCLASWNAIMLKGFADAYKALQDPEYLAAALRNADFISKKMWSPDGFLFRSYKDGKATINGYLEDYAHVIDAFIALYQITLDEKWLHDAKQLADHCLSHFYDEQAGFFRFKSDTDTELIAPHFEIEDNVIPASNSVMASNLDALSIYFENAHYETISRSMTEHIIPLIDYPSAFSNWLSVFLNYSGDNRELAVCGKDAAASALEIQSHYLPDVIVAGADKPSTLPFLKNRFAENEQLFYVCRNKTCGLPHHDIQTTLNDLLPDNSVNS
jgi:uncharacterized protein YyaL (SSP411 family)